MAEVPFSVSDTVLRMVLAQVNKDQNQHYPPNVFESHYSMVTHFLIDEGAKIYPGTQSIMDLMNPYIKTILLKVDNGKINFPNQYRHLLGFGIYIKEVPKTEENKCGLVIDNDFEELIEVPTADQLEALVAETQSFNKDVTTVSIGRWNKLTQHRYNRPDLENPIVCSFNSGIFKISPFDVPFAEVRFIVKTPEFKYGYAMNDDDTFYFDPETTTEALWTEAAISYLVKGVTTLYNSYAKDTEGIQLAKDLRNSGLF